jgi:dimethylglycine catabolism A
MTTTHDLTDEGVGTSAAFPTLFSPIQIGTMKLRNRTMLPPHGSAIGNLFGTQAEADRNIAYWEARAKAGAAWIDGITGHIRNPIIPGFEPTGVGAATDGFYRLPYFVERIQQFSDTMHAAGATASAQMVHQGGMPHGASSIMSSPVINLAPHVLDRDEIKTFMQEYRFSAGQAQAARLDGIELHMNHDDILEWFLSPLTNHREDEYGGSMENRARFSIEALENIRDVVGSTMTVGVRINLREEVPGGYDANEGIQIAQYLESTGLIDYFHVVVGTPWGNPSYIQPTYYDDAQWADLSGNFRRAVSLPVVHTGRVNSPEVAERVLAAGHADVVGMARAHIADGELLLKAKEGRTQDIRPCVGGNECISRRYVEGLPFGCAVNPHTSKEVDGPWPPAQTPQKVLVVGGGPAGMELAALSREAGHDVELWEAGDALGGQLRIAIKAPRHEGYIRYLAWQERRLGQLGVDVKLGYRATAELVEDAGADVVAIATGATSRTPAIDGVTAEHVHDIRDVLNGTAVPGHRVLVLAQDDHVPPLSVADYLAERGHQVTVVYATPGPAPLLGRYIAGGILGRLSERGVQMRFMEEVVAIKEDSVRTRNVYSGREEVVGDIDSVVLACAGISDSGLYDQLKRRLPQVHILGDAYAPRRLVFATRQAFALAQSIGSHA